MKQLKEFSVSDRKTRLRCGGFLSEETSIEARRGQMIHQELEDYFTELAVFGKSEGTEYAKSIHLLLEDKFPGFEILDVEAKLLGNYTSRLEHKLNLLSYGKEVIEGIVFSGKPDLVIKCDGQIHILDFKSGFHPENYGPMQLRSYAVLLLHCFEQAESQESIAAVTETGISAAYVMVDAQFVKTGYCFDYQELLDDWETIRSEVLGNVRADLVPGTEQCRYCSRKAVCPALVFAKDPEIFEKQSADQWEYLKNLRLRNKAASELEKRLEVLLVEKLKTGEELVGVKLRPTRRYEWMEEQLFNKAKSLGIKAEELRDNSRLAKTTEIEAVLRMAGLGKDEIKELKKERITSYSIKEAAA